jgi:hypothetical protein
MRWRMEKKCADCPFASRGSGLRLRKSLRPGRWQGILDSLANGNYFPCHQTTNDEGNGGLVCAGSIEWQDRHSYSSAYVRIAAYQERMEKQRARPKPRSFPRSG